MHGGNSAPRFMPPLRGSHLFFCGDSRGSVAPVSAAVQLRRGRSPLHRGLFYGAPPGLVSSAGMRPRAEGAFSLGWPMNGCMGAIPRHALCHPSGVRICYLGRFRGVGASSLRFLRPHRPPLAGLPSSRLPASRLCYAVAGHHYCMAPRAQMTIKGVMRGSRRNMKGAMVMEPTRQRGASVTIMTALPA